MDVILELASQLEEATKRLRESTERLEIAVKTYLLTH